ncbi:hypothetical protein NQ176_g4039 [Zarea fungicola]|uniref:Uncharacterized protein n=1 Tax=Zarea fungicola TaxID=93591 RepID=A0ACC1NG45_9HYPO|nr:hypothetical protein NQ176_g4039 [Lecanicillium fungicola]
MICSFANDHGRHLVLLAVSGVDDVSCLFRGTDSNSVLVHARNDSTVERDITILVSEGNSVERAIAAVVYHARTLIWKYAQAGSSQTEAENPGDFKPKWRENWYDGLGYCTWNSLGQNLSQDKILYALDKLQENSINISNLIIDDNWQSIDVSDEASAQPSWLDFEANSYGFPDGLKGAVSKIKSKHRNIQHVFVWHALLGYWGGISPRGRIAQKYKTLQVKREDDGSNMTIIALDDISKMYDDFYSFLIRCGIDGVKTDAQCMLDTIANAPARKELTNAYLDKWSIASLRHFGSNAISCMSQFPQAIFHAFMPQIRPPLVVRNSDDYFPDVPSSHRWHIWANAHNNILSQYLNVVPDWDMFQTVHDFADFHVAARCLSGGPIYITDTPGEHNIELLKQFTANTTLGKTVILRPSVVGIAMDPYLHYDSGSLLKIGSYHGSATGGVSILGVFQTSEAQNACLIPLNEFRGMEEPGTYVVRAYTTGRVSDTLKLTGDLTPLVLATPSTKGYEIYSAYKLQSFESSQCGDVSVASLGLIDKMTGCAAIESSSYLVGNSKISLVTKLRALGSLGIYISSLPDMNIDDNFMVTIFGHPVPRNTVQVSAAAEAVLEVDVQAAWRELGLDSGWSNELEVTVNVLGI